MSFYATMQGEIQYPDRESFDTIVDQLKVAGWMDKEGYFTDECGTRVNMFEPEHPDIDIEGLIIGIPLCHYRNLSWVEFFTSGAKGNIVGTSTDGCFEGWTIENGEEVGYDLEKWAAENLEGDDALPPDDPEDFENLCIWQQVVEQEFFADFS